MVIKKPKKARWGFWHYVGIACIIAIVAFVVYIGCHIAQIGPLIPEDAFMDGF